MMKLAVAHWKHLPVWSAGNVYLSGAKAWKNEDGALVLPDADVYADVEEVDGKPVLKTNVYEFIKGYSCEMIDSDVLGKAFEPEQRFENPDGSAITFDTDYNGDSRADSVIPGPFAAPV